MKPNRSGWFLLSFFFLLTWVAAAQKPKTPKTTKKPAQQQPATKTTKKPATQKTEPAKPATTNTPQQPNAVEDEKRVRDMVAFFEFMLNTLGSSSTSARDKEVLVRDSYSKVFRDGKVQVEDDLDTDRKVITNKDVTAYLKDVDFFFDDVKFEFSIEAIQSGTMAGGNTFYKVSLRRNLKGTTTDGVAVNNTVPRYLEINYDPKNQDLRIVSIYTNLVNEKESLTQWWKALSFEWQEILQRAGKVSDSVSFPEIKKIRAIQSLDLSHNTYIQNLEPLTDFTGLRTLNVSHTAITDLGPIRNQTDLEKLDASYTGIHDLTPLKYSINLQELNVRETSVSDISILERMPRVQKLDVSHTLVTSFDALDVLTELTELNVETTKFADVSLLQPLTKVSKLDLSRTQVSDVAPLKLLTSLTTLDLDSTNVRNVSALSALENLQTLSINTTQVTDLQPLQKLPRLQKIYADHTAITRDAAYAFHTANPKVLVVFDSKDMNAWWEALPDEWKEVVGKTAKFGLTPAKEELARVNTIDSINFKGFFGIRDLEPLRKMLKLRVVIAGQTHIQDLSPLQDHRDIRYLDISETDVTDLSVVSRFTKLKVLLADKSKIEKIDPLFDLPNLEKLYADNTMVHDIIAQELFEKNPKCLIVYKTIHLNRWWKGLSPEWKEVMRGLMDKDTTTTRENLHRLVEREAIAIKDSPVSDLTALSEFVRPKELHFSGTAVSNIAPLANFRMLRSLHITNGPLQNIEVLNQLTALEDLDLSNTPIDEIKVLSTLTNLKTFNAAGTQIKRLDPLQGLQNLTSLDCSNTNVSKIEPLEGLPLKTLKCYNTKVSNRTIESFKSRHPECNVVYYR
ncbi:leucine-rich repeat domain-containing protein [Chryseolinea lacunae]|uniref:Leucine-rich repeat domain-containing protein n=1 Tax=Chryseolinea lacunae TaxID=2801331 RepID=A0ABS1KMW8_9BACT|nr:leucine-rich repeat domain-containing protein [Chryseolinea lacunae]MBL0740808.1 leucine-rich repeat domain-containing protein [Chryseolinea lacunae]